MSLHTLLVVALAIVAGGIVTLALLSAASRRRPALGTVDGQLRPCPRSPHGVGTREQDDSHRIEPLRFDDSPEQAWARLQKVMSAWPRTRVLSVTDTYLHVECASTVFRFLDDVEFLLDRDAHVIHFRSCSRVGLGDLGANRRRMEGIRERFEQAEDS